MFNVLRIETLDAWDQMLFIAMQGCEAYPAGYPMMEDGRAPCASPTVTRSERAKVVERGATHASGSKQDALTLQGSSSSTFVCGVASTSCTVPEQSTRSCSPPSFAFKPPAQRRNPQGLGWVGTLILFCVVIFGSYVLPTVLIGIVAISFDEASRRATAIQEMNCQVISSAPQGNFGQ